MSTSSLDIVLSTADCVIAISYIAIPIAMVYYMRTIKGLKKFRLILFMFVSFILLCGFTHLISFWAPWWSTPAFMAAIKILCAVVSALTAISMFIILPKLLVLPQYALQMEMKAQEHQANERRLSKDYQSLLLFRHISQNIRRTLDEETILRTLNDEMIIRFGALVSCFYKKSNNGYVKAYESSDVVDFTMNDLNSTSILVKRLQHRVGAVCIEDPDYSLEEIINFGSKRPVKVLLTFVEIGDVKNAGLLAVVFDCNEKQEVAVVDFRNLLPDIIDNVNVALQLSLQMTKQRESQTELQEVNALLVRAQQEAQLAQAQKEFLAVMSHEMRTPLFAISGLSAMLLESKYFSDPPNLDACEHQEMISAIANSGNMLIAIVNNILDFTKAEDEFVFLNNEPFDIRHAVEDAISFVLLQKEEDDFPMLNYYIDPMLPSSAKGDFTRFRQIIVNLLNNACKFTDPSGIVWVRLLRIDSKDQENMVGLKIEISDTGIGIPDDAMSKLYDKFFQVDKSNTRSYGGTGLGLAVVKRLVQMMGGTIYAVSHVGKGTTFHVELYLNVDPKCLAIQKVFVHQTLSLGYFDKSSANFEGFVYTATACGVKVDEIKHIKSLAALESAHNYDGIVVDMSTVSFENFSSKIRSKFKANDILLVGNPSILRNWRRWRQEHFKNNDVQVSLRPLKRDVLMRFLCGLDIAELDELAFAQAEMEQEAESASQTWSSSIENSARTRAELQKSTLSLSPSTISHSSSDLGKLKILVAEDNTMNQMVLKKMFSKLRQDITIANNGKEAVEMVLRDPTYDVIFMDLMMPLKDGYQATAEIREFMASIPGNNNYFTHKGRDAKPWIVALTANAFASDRLKCLESGMNDFVAKPASIHDIESALKKFIDCSSP